MVAIFSSNFANVRDLRSVSTCFLTRVSFSPQNRVPQNAVRDLVDGKAKSKTNEQ